MEKFQIKAKAVSEYSFTIRANSEQEAALGARELILAGYQTPFVEEMEMDCRVCKENSSLWVNRHQRF